MEKETVHVNIIFKISGHYVIKINDQDSSNLRNSKACNYEQCIFGRLIILENLVFWP